MKENIKYLEGLLGTEKILAYQRKLDGKMLTSEENESAETIGKCLAQMDAAGDNRWWQSDDPRVIGFYQLMNPLLLVKFATFHESLECLLERPVWTHELGFNLKGLQEEARCAFYGDADTDEQKAETIIQSFQQLTEQEKPMVAVVG